MRLRNMKKWPAIGLTFGLPKSTDWNIIKTKGHW
uniref:Uncharacterized protein n=1 Tax=Anguilla anguilla TaxID=7936 RepID=A0A0E9RBJ8_ANGAN